MNARQLGTLLLSVSVAGAWLIAPPPAGADEHEVVHDVEMQTHVELGFAEQDVFVETEAGSSSVVRPDVDDADDDETRAKALYAAVRAIEHDPFRLSDAPLGPFDRGRRLGLTLGEWLDAEGSGTYTVAGDEARLELEFEGLVPGGVYTVWCVRASMPPETGGEDLPCGAADGSENAFEADDDGSASIELDMAPLEASSETEVSLVAVAYHSDSKTYGEAPGEFGRYTHVQLAWMLPAAEGVAEAEAEAGGEADADAGATSATPSDLPKAGFTDSPALPLFGIIALLLLAGAGAGWMQERGRRAHTGG